MAEGDYEIELEKLSNILGINIDVNILNDYTGKIVSGFSNIRCKEYYLQYDNGYKSSIYYDYDVKNFCRGDCCRRRTRREYIAGHSAEGSFFVCLSKLMETLEKYDSEPKQLSHEIGIRIMFLYKVEQVLESRDNIAVYEIPSRTRNEDLIETIITLANLQIRLWKIKIPNPVKSARSAQV